MKRKIVYNYFNVHYICLTNLVYELVFTGMLCYSNCCHFIGSSAEERVNKIFQTLLKELVMESNQDETFARLKKKLMVFEADLSQPYLALKESEYSCIKTTVDLVIHNGAIVNHILQYNGELRMCDCNTDIIHRA